MSYVFPLIALESCNNVSLFAFSSDDTQQVSQVTRAPRLIQQNRDNLQPIRGQYSCHVISLGQSETSIPVRNRDNSGPIWLPHRHIYNNSNKDKNKLYLLLTFTVQTRATLRAFNNN